MRYIDDLLTLNNPQFEQEIPHIYPIQLELEKTTESRHKLSYLDLCIKFWEGVPVLGGPHSTMTPHA